MPAFSCYTYSSTEHRSLHLLGLKDALSRLLSAMSMSCYAEDAYIMRKMMVKMHGPFRRHKHYRLFKRALHCLHMLTVFPSRSYLADLLSAMHLEANDTCTFPSAACLTYGIVQGQVFLRWLQQLVELTEQCGMSTCQQLAMGVFVDVNMILVGVLARVRSTAVRQKNSVLQKLNLADPLLASLKGDVSFDLDKQLRLLKSDVSLNAVPFGATRSTTDLDSKHAETVNSWLALRGLHANMAATSAPPVSSIVCGDYYASTPVARSFITAATDIGTPVKDQYIRHCDIIKSARSLKALSRACRTAAGKNEQLKERLLSAVKRLSALKKNDKGAAKREFKRLKKKLARQFVDGSVLSD